MDSLKKKIYECDMLDAYEIDIEKINNTYKATNPNGKSEFGVEREYCELVAESNEYNFYSYRTYSDGSGGFLLRQDKRNPMNVVYFGDCYKFNCVFHKYLFQVNQKGYADYFHIICKNIENGEIKKLYWLSNKAGEVRVINGFARFYSQDSVNDVFVQDDKLIFKVTRKKSDAKGEDDKNKFNIDTDYKLVVTSIGGKLKATAVYPANIGKASKTSNRCFGRDLSKQLQCEYKGNEKDCTDKCDKCAFHIKEVADVAMSQNKLDEAIALYKKAIFIESRYADAWVCIGKAYMQKGNYNKSIDAFDRALSIDAIYGEAIFNKAIALQKIGRLNDAISILNDLIAMNDNPEVIAFKKRLIDLGAKDVYQLDAAIEIMTDKAMKIASQNNLLDKDGKARTERAIYKKTEFASKIFDYCKRKYVLLGEDKVRSESIITSFYASLCTTLFYYKDKDGLANIHPFEYIKDHIDLEKADVNAERMLGMKSGEEEAEALWNMIYDYAQFSVDIISKVDVTDSEAAIIDATESAYVLGMMYAMHAGPEKSLTGRESIDMALEKLAESSKDYVNPPDEPGAMCYSLEPPSYVDIAFKCDNCGNTAVLKVFEGEEEIIEKYRNLTYRFAELGHKTEVLCYCDECANSLFPSAIEWLITHNIVFSFLANGLSAVNCSNIANTPVYSFPSTKSYDGFKYELALCFLNGSNTIKELSKETDTQFKADYYLREIRSIVGSTDLTWW